MPAAKTVIFDRSHPSRDAGEGGLGISAEQAQCVLGDQSRSNGVDRVSPTQYARVQLPPALLGVRQQHPRRDEHKIKRARSGCSLSHRLDRALAAALRDAAMTAATRGLASSAATNAPPIPPLAPHTKARSAGLKLASVGTESCGSGIAHPRARKVRSENFRPRYCTRRSCALLFARVAGCGTARDAQKWWSGPLGGVARRNEEVISVARQRPWTPSPQG